MISKTAAFGECVTFKSNLNILLHNVPSILYYFHSYNYILRSITWSMCELKV